MPIIAVGTVVPQASASGPQSQLGVNTFSAYRSEYVGATPTKVQTLVAISNSPVVSNAGATLTTITVILTYLARQNPTVAQVTNTAPTYSGSGWTYIGTSTNSSQNTSFTFTYNLPVAQYQATNTLSLNVNLSRAASSPVTVLLSASAANAAPLEPPASRTY